MTTHRSRRTYQFFDRFALGPDREQQLSNGVRVGFAAQHLIDQMTGLFRRQVFAGLDVSNSDGKVNHFINQWIFGKESATVLPMLGSFDSLPKNKMGI